MIGFLNAKTMALPHSRALLRRNAYWISISFTRVRSNLSLILATLCLCSGCPTANVPLGVSETVHDFRDSECLWRFYVYNPGSELGAFRVSSDVLWVKVLTPIGVVAPNGHSPVMVRLDRSAIGKSDFSGTLTVSYGDDAAFGSFVDIYATDGAPHYVRLREFWPFDVGYEWTYASRSEDIGGPAGDATLVKTSRYAVTGHTRRLGIEVWTMQYEDVLAKSSTTLYAVFLDEYPVFVKNSDDLSLLPNREAFIDAVLADDVTEYWLKGIFEPGDLGVYTNSTRYTTLTLGEITPMRYLTTAGKLRAGDFPAPRSTACLALLGDPYAHPRQRRLYFALLADGIGPLMDPFGGSGILQSYGNLAR